MTQDSPFDGLKIEEWPGGIESHHFAANRDSQRRRVNSGCVFGWRWVDEFAGCCAADNEKAGRRPSFFVAENVEHES
jgi:hypothetical protein